MAKSNYYAQSLVMMFCCSFVDNGQEMYHDLSNMYRVIVLLMALLY